ncbi:MAG: hypothetical protein V3R85_02610 [Alphaproteobacteria bacterium]
MRISYRAIVGRAGLAVAIAAITWVGALAQRAPDLTPRGQAMSDYSDCMELARADPIAAHKSALAWRARGGGEAAIHCVAVALLGLGEYTQAARAMEGLVARTAAKRPDLRAGLLAQAANTWLIAGKPRAALAAQNKSLALRPNDVATLIDRSIANTSLARDWDALDDLNRALELDPDRTEALIFRAAAWRRVEGWDLAAQDINRALALRADNPDALLERGLIRRQRGDKAGARADWLKLLEISADGPLTEAARLYLQALDVK